MITIYGNQICGYCNRAKRLLERNNLDYIWLDTDDTEIFNELKQRIRDATIPQIWWGEEYIGGYYQLATRINKLTNENQ